MNGSGSRVVVAAAVQNFQSRGYHGTSIRDIARDAGMTPATIYHYFPSKQRILQHIMEAAMKDVIASTNAALIQAGNSPTEQLDALMRAWALFHTQRRAEALIGASEIRSLDDVGHRIVVALRDQQEQMFRVIIDRGVAEGAFTTAYPHEAARAIISMGSSIASWYRPNGHLTPEQIAQRYAELALGTVGAQR
ncbi:TetR family transcriptional regulator [Mycobacterium sp. MS1601]|uniref:TetR family transcriptional regulator n=1 Tax=Mycobacterium sp. MS1601 TaxID=1936029 RepID=UPI001F1DDA61|nr:TetR family transcriptional regulator [Mycobacterium sp. MS1601]